MDGWMVGRWVGGRRLKRKNKNVISYTVCRYIENPKVFKNTLLEQIREFDNFANKYRKVTCDLI